jgi:hypothetical protein
MDEKKTSGKRPRKRVTAIKVAGKFSEAAKEFNNKHKTKSND